MRRPAGPFQDGAEAPRQGHRQEVPAEEPLPLLVPGPPRPDRRRKGRGAQGPGHQEPRPLPRLPSGFALSGSVVSIAVRFGAGLPG